MTKVAHRVEPGDWFVHAHFGAGCIKGQEVKCVGEQEQSYFELETALCTLWLPEEQLFSQKVRPLAGEAEFQQMVDVLKEPSEEMSSDAKQRKLRIKEVREANMPTETAGLVRDLWVREQDEGKLYDWERQAWRELCGILIQEWALCLDISGGEARQQIGRTLTEQEAIRLAGNAKTNGTPESNSLLESVTAEEQKWSAWRAEAIA